MDIRNIRALKKTAGEKLEQSRNADRILLIYLGISTGLALAVTIINLILNRQTANLSGLSNLGNQAFLSAIQTVLSIVESIVVLCLELGYLSAMLRVGRDQFTSPNGLRLGFDRFWLLLRCLLAQFGVYFAVIVGCCYLASILFTLSPFSGDFLALMRSGAITLPLVVGSAEFETVLSTMIPMLVMCFILLAVILIPLTYSYRMIYYVIIDNPGMGGFAVLQESKKMMRGNRMALLKLDLSFWWYYLLLYAISLLGSSKEILLLLGISLSLPDDVLALLSYILFLAAQFAIYRFFRNRVETTYALVYESVCPSKESEGLVLGNIFQM